jgi:anti-sigma factor RsiW
MTEKPYITCKELITFLCDYLDGSLAPERRHEFDRHLAVCPSCTEYLSSYRETIRIVKRAGQVPIEDVPADVIAAVMATITKR